MEFLAESIGLLDMDGGAYSTPSPHQQCHKETTPQESNDDLNDGIVETTTLYSFLFSGWGETTASSESTITKEKGTVEDAGYAAGMGNEQNIPPLEVCDTCACPGEWKTKLTGTAQMDSEQEGDGELLGASSLSLPPALDPASPMTLSSSSLNLLPLTTNEGKSGKSQCNSKTCNTQESQSHASICHNACGENDSLHSEHHTTAPVIPTPATAFMPPIDNVLTRHVTQRIDARTNYNLFTGNVDGVTGHLIHGTMLYKQAGTVYEGAFITQYVETGANPNEEAEIIASPPCDMVPLRHGNNATCTWSNGMTFVGSFEYDHPKAGTWIGGGGWTYDGPLVVVVVPEQHELIGKYHVHKGTSSDGTKYGTFAKSQSSYKIHSLTSVIGIPHPLPGSVLFDGKGRFARSDGLVYEGEFQQGLANGVGKEILSSENGQGGGTYYGEFRDGLRHGVGTLMENCDDEESTSGNSDECGYCHGRKRDGDDYSDEFANDQQEHSMPLGHDESIVSRLDGNDNCNKSGVEDVNGNDQGVRPGPDYAAGFTISSTDVFNPTSVAGVGALSSSRLASSDCISNSDDIGTSNGTAKNDIVKPFVHSSNNNMDQTANSDSDAETALSQSPKSKIIPLPSEQCRSCYCQNRQSNKAKKQRYSSGVWCAGRYEIEDCRGTVNSAAAAAPATATSETPPTAVDEGGNANGESPNYSMAVSSLNRTTWDMLDEKWLGI